VTELAYDTLFSERVVQAAVPENLSYALPADFGGVRNLWLFSGQNCTVENRANIYRKRNYRTRGNGYLANNDWYNMDDPFHEQEGASEPLGLYWWEIQNGVLMFSSNSRDYARFHLEYNGMGMVFGEDFHVPMFMRDAVRDYATHGVLLVKYREDPKLYGPMIQLFAAQKHDSFQKARERVVMMDQKAREDLYETLARFGPR